MTEPPFIIIRGAPHPARRLPEAGTALWEPNEATALWIGLRASRGCKGARR